MENITVTWFCSYWLLESATVVGQLLEPSVDVVYLGREFWCLLFERHCECGDAFVPEKVGQRGVFNVVVTQKHQAREKTFRLKERKFFIGVPKPRCNVRKEKQKTRRKGRL